MFATTEQLSSMLGLTVRRVNQLCSPDDEETPAIFFREESGELDLFQAIPAYLKFKEASGPKAAKLIAETEIAQLKAKADDRKDKLEEKELVYLRDVRKVWRTRLSSIRQQCSEWHQRCMDIGDLKPMQREEQDNEFITFFNDLDSSGN